MEQLDITPDYCKKDVLVLGCGNVLLGDDGFGPAVIEYILKQPEVPANACFINAHTSVREVLFDMTLSAQKPRKIIIVDCMEFRGKPGEVSQIPIESIPIKKIDDFSMHQIPTSNLLRELKEHCHMDIDLIVCEPEHIPEEVAPGLSDTVRAAVAKAAELVLGKCADKR